MLWELAIQHCNNTASCICQSLSLGDTFPGVWLSIRTGLVTVFTCGPSASFRLIPYKPYRPFSLSFFSSPYFSSAPSDEPGIGCWPCINNATTRFKQKTQSLSTFSQKAGSIHCAAGVAPTKARICKLLFYTLCLWKKKKKTSNRGYIKQRTRTL